MTRVPLGHTGRPIAAGRVMTGAFILINVAAVLRVGVPSMIPLAGILWALGFGIYFVTFLPVHFGPSRAS
jgi:uncharacterized protein involved in response to NO